MKTTRKLKDVFETLFIVEGVGEFPMDMLRYDSCFPATESDSHIATHTGEARQVKLRRRALASVGPTEGRWSSFGWKVVQICEPEF